MPLNKYQTTLKTIIVMINKVKKTPATGETRNSEKMTCKTRKPSNKLKQKLKRETKFTTTTKTCIHSIINNMPVAFCNPVYFNIYIETISFGNVNFGMFDPYYY